MFDSPTAPHHGPDAPPETPPAGAVAVPEPVDPLGLLSSVLALLPATTTRLPEAGIIDAITLAEQAKNALAAFQARAAVSLDHTVRARHQAEGLPRDEIGKGVHAQLALARAESPNTGHRLLGLARAVVNEMPHTHQAFAQGRLSEWRATLLVRETACLDLADRQKVDEQLLADPSILEGTGTRALIARARQLAYAASPTAVADRARRAVADRRVCLRPAPDTMSILTGLLPVVHGVSVLKALTLEADRLVGIGDGRSRGQIMADTLVERVTGQATAGDVRLEVQLVMTDRTLFQGESEPAQLPGYGIIPAQIARDLIRNAENPEHNKTSTTTATATGNKTSGGTAPGSTASGTGKPAPATPPGPDVLPEHKDLVWLRRLYTAPGTGDLVAMDSRSRLFPPGLARFIDTRDQTCSGPWCDAPGRHHDHIISWATGGKTTADNSNYTCADCNLTKEAPGWSATTVPGDRHTTIITTPTGHTYRSQSPPLPGHTR